MEAFFEKIGKEISAILKSASGQICDAIIDSGQIKVTFSVTIRPEGLAGIRMLSTLKKISKESTVSNATQEKLDLK